MQVLDPQRRCAYYILKNNDCLSVLSWASCVARWMMGTLLVSGFHVSCSEIPGTRDSPESLTRTFPRELEEEAWEGGKVLGFVL